MKGVTKGTLSKNERFIFNVVHCIQECNQEGKIGHWIWSKWTTGFSMQLQTWGRIYSAL